MVELSAERVCGRDASLQSRASTCWRSHQIRTEIVSHTLELKPWNPLSVSSKLENLPFQIGGPVSGKDRTTPLGHGTLFSGLRKIPWRDPLVVHI